MAVAPLPEGAGSCLGAATRKEDANRIVSILSVLITQGVTSNTLKTDFYLPTLFLRAPICFFLEISFCFIKADTKEGMKRDILGPEQNSPRLTNPVLFSWKRFPLDFN